MKRACDQPSFPVTVIDGRQAMTQTLLPVGTAK
jgi:hypothetical protein